MRVLRYAESLNNEIKSTTDPHIAHLLTRHVQFAIASEDLELGLLTVLVVEQGDTLQTVDDAMDGHFLEDAYFDRRYGDPDFKPCFETLEEYPTFYEMLFVQSDEGHCVTVLIPKSPGIDPELLALCSQHATPATEPSP